MNWIKNLFGIKTREEIERIISSRTEYVNDQLRDYIFGRNRSSSGLKSLLDHINKTIKLKPKYGEPYEVRARIYYNILEKDLNANRDMINKAISDIETAQKLGTRKGNRFDSLDTIRGTLDLMLFQVKNGL
ncbi:MAG TPA: hypothetical protein VIK55_18865 [Paludibacter sp.]